MKSVWVSLINFKGKENTIDCLNSLEKITKDNFDLKVIVVNNGSTEKLTLPKYSFSPKILESKKNLGFSGGHNLGIKFALEKDADYVLILNNDTLVDKNLVSELLRSVESNPIIGIAAPKIYFAPGFEFHKNRYKKNELGQIIWYAGGDMDWKNILASHKGVDEVDKGQFDKTEPTDFASGCCMLIKRDVFEKIGFFDERYFLYYEDNDFCQRARKKGFKVIYAPKAILWHKNASSAGGSGSDLQDYYITRNRLTFGMRYASLKSKLSLIRESLALLFSGRKWQRRGVLDFFSGNLGKGSYG